mmetsp:Transcript_125051/g.389286  ORF Transcript_125051/g.389286 Transcript_125051/m.389286 type:complete len:214 (+) Transcript_125051:37-678(+)
MPGSLRRRAVHAPARSSEVPHEHPRWLPPDGRRKVFRDEASGILRKPHQGGGEPAEAQQQALEMRHKSSQILNRNALQLHAVLGSSTVRLHSGGQPALGLCGADHEPWQGKVDRGEGLFRAVVAGRLCRLHSLRVRLWPQQEGPLGDVVRRSGNSVRNVAELHLLRARGDRAGLELVLQGSQAVAEQQRCLAHRCLQPPHQVLEGDVGPDPQT